MEGVEGSEGGGEKENAALELDWALCVGESEQSSFGFFSDAQSNFIRASAKFDLPGKIGK